MPDGRPGDHGRRRDRALLRTVGASAGLQVATVLGAVLSLPFVTRALSTAEYGAVVTIAGFVALLGFADLGVGSALTQRLAGADQDDTATRAEVVSSAFVAAAAAAAVVLSLGVLALPLVHWQGLLGTTEVSERGLQECILALTVSTSVAIVGGLGQRALYAVQRGGSANGWLVLATVAGAFSSIAVAQTGAPLWVYVAALVGSPALVSVACACWTFTATEVRVRLRLRAVTASALRELCSTGGWFLLIAVSAAAAFQTDALVVSSVLGASSAAVFSVAARVTGLLTSSAHPALLQLWPAFSEALARGDTAWVRLRFWWATALAAGGAAFLGLVLVWIGPALIGTWLTPDLAPPRSLLISMVAWIAFSLGSSPLFYLLNAIGRVRAHALMSLAAASVNLPLSLALTHRIGIEGPVLGSLASSALFAVLPAAILVRKVLWSDSPEAVVTTPPGPFAPLA